MTAAEARAAGRGMFCIRCGYELAGLASPVCPECGRRFDPARRRTYSRWPRWRRFARRAVRVAAVLFLLLAAAGGWLYYRYSVEQDAIGRLASVKAAGGYYGTALLGPDWWNQWAGPRGWPTLTVVATIDFEASPVTDEDLAWIGRLGALEELSFNGARVTDAGARHLRGLRSLHTLNIYGSDVTDAGLQSIGSLTKLKALDLFASDVTDAGMPNLAQLRRLEELSLASTRVTDAGLIHLHNLPALRTLDVSDTAVTDKGVGALRQALPHIVIVPWDTIPEVE